MRYIIQATQLDRSFIVNVSATLVVILSVCMLGTMEAAAAPFGSYTDIPAGTESAATDLPQRPPTLQLRSLTFWNDELMFETSYPNLIREDFSGTNAGPQNFSSCAGPFNDSTNNGCFSPGAIVGGISIDNQQGGPNVIVTPGYFSGIADFLVGPSSFSHDAVILFDDGVEAFGANMYNPFAVIPLSIEVFGGSGSLGSTSTTGSPGGEFFGVSSDGELITRIEVVAGGQGGEVFGNMRFFPAPSTSVESAMSGAAPSERLILRQNRPNPFNPTTSIHFDLPYAAFVSVHLYDSSGRKLRTLLSGGVLSGQHVVQWDGRDENGRSVGSGVYLYRLEVGSMVLTRKMAIVR